MAAPIRNIGNKFFSTLGISTIYSNMTLLVLIDIDNDNFNVRINNNYKKAKWHTMFSKMNTSRTVSMFSNKTSVDNATKIEWLNDSLNKEVVRNSTNSSQLSYANERKIGNLVSEVADSRAIKEQHGYNENLALNRITSISEHVYNV